MDTQKGGMLSISYRFIRKAWRIEKLAQALLRMKRRNKRIFVIAIDSGLCVFTVWFAYYLRLGFFVPLHNELLIVAMTAIIIAVSICYAFGLYNTIYRYFGATSLILLVKAISLYGVVFAFIFTVISFQGIPRTVGIIQPVLLLLAISVSRVLIRVWLNIDGSLGNAAFNNCSRRVMIYGTDETGRQFAAIFAGDPKIKLCGFLDPDTSLHKQDINGYPVHDPSEILSLVDSYKLTDVLVAFSSVSRSSRNAIVRQIQGADIAVRILPSLSALARGEVKVSDLRELSIEDLLGRELVEPIQALFSKNITGKNVLITGAGGSIGSELCRQVIGQHPSALLLLERSEFSLYSIHEELTSMSTGQVDIIPLLASVDDRKRMRQIMQTWNIETVYHAAAYKHVPLVEQNVEEGIGNNLFGTITVAQVAMESGVHDFVMVSSDKAVRPTNMMGASKRLAEIAIQALAAKVYNEGSEGQGRSIKFSIVRFGNVLNSSGSVVPKFKEQIRRGGPVTVTHSDVTRYFMTISEAAQLVIQAGALSGGGDVFLLDMGKPVRIVDLATRMIELSGLSVKNTTFNDGDIEISITGLRPGEKLYEELLINDKAKETLHPRIMKGSEPYIPWNILEPKLTALRDILNTNNVEVVYASVRELVVEYQPITSAVDWLYLADNHLNEYKAVVQKQKDYSRV